MENTAHSLWQLSCVIIAFSGSNTLFTPLSMTCMGCAFLLHLHSLVCVYLCERERHLDTPAHVHKCISDMARTEYAVNCVWSVDIWFRLSLLYLEPHMFICKTVARLYTHCRLEFKRWLDFVFCFPCIYVCHWLVHRILLNWKRGGILGFFVGADGGGLKSRLATQWTTIKDFYREDSSEYN